jgi:ferredoxin
MDAVFAAARARGWPEESLSREYFSVPEPPPYVNHPFALRLSSGRTVQVGAEETAVEALGRAGVIVPTKCSDGICGVCAVKHGGTAAIEHRDYVLSARDREARIVLCCSRAADEGATVEITL